MSYNAGVKLIFCLYSSGEVPIGIIEHKINSQVHVVYDDIYFLKICMCMHMYVYTYTKGKKNRKMNAKLLMVFALERGVIYESFCSFTLHHSALLQGVLIKFKTNLALILEKLWRK